MRTLVSSLLAAALLTPLAAQDVSLFDVVLPQVARGDGDISIQTLITISNPHSETVEFTLSARPESLLTSGTFQLMPGATQEVLVAGGDLTSGTVEVTAAQTLGVSAHLTRMNVQGETISHVSVPAVPFAKSFVVPVFKGSSLADTTSFAFALASGGTLRLTLRRPDGSIAAERELHYAAFGSELTPPEAFDFIGGQWARYLDEIFEDLPADFISGSLVAEYADGPYRAFAVMALYEKEDVLRSSQAVPIDTEGSFELFLPADAPAPEDLAATLAQQYGFVIEFALGGTPYIAVIDTTLEQARALARDSRVSQVHHEATVF